MGKKRKKGDFRNFFIVLLLLIVAVETFLLLNPSQPKKNNKSQPTAQKKDPHLIALKKPQPLHPQEESLGVSSPRKIPAAVAQPKSRSYEPVKFESVTNARIAIILDDWGYRLESCRDLKIIDSPLAVAILPGLSHSREVAQCAHDANKIVMLHLPLEPHKYSEHYSANYIITTSMRQQRIEKILEKNLKDIPFVVGVNNHMGSKATEDRRVMSIILTRLKEKGLFFVDSLVTSKSVCRSLSRQINIPIARRDIFLDNQNEREYIENQFDQLADLAKRNGFAIAIGHDRPLTLQIVREQVEKLKKEGFKIVSIEEFLR